MTKTAIMTGPQVTFIAVTVNAVKYHDIDQFIKKLFFPESNANRVSAYLF